MADKEIICPVCKKRFSTKAALLSHTGAKHEGNPAIKSNTAYKKKDFRALLVAAQILCVIQIISVLLFLYTEYISIKTQTGFIGLYITLAIAIISLFVIGFLTYKIIIYQIGNGRVQKAQARYCTINTIFMIFTIFGFMALGTARAISLLKGTVPGKYGSADYSGVREPIFF